MTRYCIYLVYIYIYDGRLHLKTIFLINCKIIYCDTTIRSCEGLIREYNTRYDVWRSGYNKGISMTIVLNK
jgi:hypothetical protein